MKKWLKTVLVVLVILVLSGIGISYAFFNYNKAGQNQKIVAGSLYLTMNEGNDTISIDDAFPETKEEARARNDNTLTFTLKGKNTSATKAINYEILLNNGADNVDQEKSRFNTKDLVFDLVEIGANNTETYILDAVSYETLEDQKIWIDKIDENTTSEVERTYRLRMWVSDDVIISESQDADYTPQQYKNLYASVKVAVEGDLEDKQLPLVVLSLDSQIENNQTYITNTISNIDSSNNSDTFTLTITSSNNNVNFIYNDTPVVTDISINDEIATVESLVEKELKEKVKKIDNNDIVLNVFEESYIIANNKKTTFKVHLVTVDNRSDSTDLKFTLKKNNNVIQEFVKHVNVVGNGTPQNVPHIELVNRSTTYNGSAVTLDSVTITNSDTTSYTGQVSYTYYKGSSCTGQQIESAPVKAGNYSVKVYAAGTGTDGSTSACGIITINKKSLTTDVTSCASKTYDGLTSANCSLDVDGKVGSDKVSVSGTCNATSAGAGQGKEVTCTNLSLLGDDRHNYDLSSASITDNSVLTIEKAPLTITINNENIAYGSLAPEYSYIVTGLVNNETVSVLNGTANYVIKNGSNTISNVSTAAGGSYIITMNGLTADNYEISIKNGVLVIDQPDGISIIGNVPVLVYGSDGELTYSYEGPGSISCTSGDITSVTCSVDSVNHKVTLHPLKATTSNVTITIKAMNNDNVIDSINVSVTVGKKALRVTADNKEMYYTETAPTYSYTVDTTDLVTGDTVSVVTGSATYTIKTVGGDIISDVSAADVGTYKIHVSGLASDNYNLVYQTGDLDILMGIYNRTATFSPNDNGIDSLSTPSGCTKDGTTGVVTCSCVTDGQSFSCSVPTPEITAPSNTPSVCGFTAISTGASTGCVTHNATVSLSSNITYYAQTYKAAITHTATFYKNGAATQTNAAGTAVDDISVTKTCTRAASYNDAVQDLTCTITSPIIVAASGFDVLGYSTESTAITSSLNPNTEISGVNSDLTYYAITKSSNPVTITFYKNGNVSQTPSGGSASTDDTVSESCYIYNGDGTCEITSPTFVAPTATPIHIGYSQGASDYTINWAEDATVNVSASASYYAQSRNDPITNTITYDNGENTTGGGSNTSCTIPSSYNGVAQSTSCSHTLAGAPTKADSVFYGWSSSVDNSVYSAETTVQITVPTTFTAVWELWAVHLGYDNTVTSMNCEESQCALDNIAGILQKSAIAFLHPSYELIYGDTAVNSYMVSNYDGSSFNGQLSCVSSDNTKVTCSLDTTNHKINVAAVGGTSGPIPITLQATSTNNPSTSNQASFMVNVSQHAATTVLSSTSGTVSYGTPVDVEITGVGDGELVCSTSDSTVATCSISENVLTITASLPEDDGATAVITVTRGATSNYLASSATYDVTTTRGALTCPATAESNVTYNGTERTFVGNECPEGSTLTTTAVGTNAGTYYSVCTANVGYYFASTCNPGKLVIAKKATTMSISPTSGSFSKGASKTITITTDGDGALSCSKSGQIASCTISGNKATVKAGSSPGTGSVTISQAAGTNYNATSKKFSATYVGTWTKDTYNREPCYRECPSACGSYDWSCNSSTPSAPHQTSSSKVCWCLK